jgi:hypothetical protein
MSAEAIFRLVKKYTDSVYLPQVALPSRAGIPRERRPVRSHVTDRADIARLPRRGVGTGVVTIEELE